MIDVFFGSGSLCGLLSWPSCCCLLIHTYIHKLYLSSDFSVAYKLVSPILITNFKSYSKNKAKKRKK